MGLFSTPSQKRTLNDVGLYFYYFDLYTDFRRIVRGPDNCGGVGWQGVLVGLIKPVGEGHGLVLHTLAEAVGEDLVEHLALDGGGRLKIGLVDRDLRRARPLPDEVRRPDAPSESLFGGRHPQRCGPLLLSKSAS